MVRNKKSGFFWCTDLGAPDSADESRGWSLDALAKEIAEEVTGNTATAVAIGFEAPLFLPLPDVEDEWETQHGYAPIHSRWIDEAVPASEGHEKLSRRYWYENAGAAAAMKGLLILRHFFSSLLKNGVSADAVRTRGGDPEPGCVWVWEAFVSSPREHQGGSGILSGNAKHRRDAYLAASAFHWFLSAPEWRGRPWHEDREGLMRVVSGDSMPVRPPFGGEEPLLLPAGQVWNIPQTVLAEVTGEPVPVGGGFTEFTIVRPLDVKVVDRARAMSDGASR